MGTNAPGAFVAVVAGVALRAGRGATTVVVADAGSTYGATIEKHTAATIARKRAAKEKSLHSADRESRKYGILEAAEPNNVLRK